MLVLAIPYTGKPSFHGHKVYWSIVGSFVGIVNGLFNTFRISTRVIGGISRSTRLVGFIYLFCGYAEPFKYISATSWFVMNYVYHHRVYHIKRIFEERFNIRPSKLKPSSFPFSFVTIYYQIWDTSRFSVVFYVYMPTLHIWSLIYIFI